MSATISPKDQAVLDAQWRRMLDEIFQSLNEKHTCHRCGKRLSICKSCVGYQVWCPHGCKGTASKRTVKDAIEALKKGEFS